MYSSIDLEICRTGVPINEGNGDSKTDTGIQNDSLPLLTCTLRLWNNLKLVQPYSNISFCSGTKAEKIVDTSTRSSYVGFKFYPMQENQSVIFKLTNLINLLYCISKHWTISYTC